MNHKSPSLSRLLIGGALIALGIFLMLTEFEVIPYFRIWNYWPLILIAIGIFKLTDRNSGIQGAYWLIVIGAWLLVSNHRMFGLGYGDTWPFLIIAWGISMMLGDEKGRSFEKSSPQSPSPTN